MGKKTSEQSIMAKNDKSQKVKKESSSSSSKSVKKVQAPVAEPEPEVQVNDTLSNLSQANVPALFEGIVNLSDTIHNNQRQMCSLLKRVFKTYVRDRRDFDKNAARDRRRAKKDPNRKKREPSGFAVATNISDSLCDFFKLDKGTKLSRTDVTRKLTAYIREQNLQVPDNRRSFNPDKKLASILGPLQEVDKDKGYTYFNLQRYITPHITSSASASAH